MILEELEEAIEYANAQYADVTINSLTAATETILPSVGNYNTKYKRTDSFALSFKPTEKYQFVKWVAAPAESVAFDNEYSLTPTVTILSVEVPISIEPRVYVRPTVSITPKNGSAVEKNNPVIITFSHPVEATIEDLNKITIMSGGISYAENFSTPSLSEDKKIITYTAKEDNLISFSEDTKDITVTVPSSYYYLADGTKVHMEKDVNYTYTVNNQTLTKLEITVNNTNTAAGSLNLNGKYKFNIGEKQNLLFSILQEYAFEKWIVKNADGQEVDHSTYSQFFDFENVKSNNTNIVVKKLAKDFVIEPVCIKRAQVVASTPAYDSLGVSRTSSIRVIFDQNMSEHSIYWTETEMNALKVSYAANGSTVTYADYKVTDKKSENNENYYYAYAVNGLNKYYKNIEIKKRGTTTSLLNGKYYGCPYFETESILVIPIGNSEDQIPEFTDIEFVLSRSFVNTNGIEMAREYSSCYRTNGKWDIAGPVFNYTSNLKHPEDLNVRNPVTFTDYIWGPKGKKADDSSWDMTCVFEDILVAGSPDPTKQAKLNEFTNDELRRENIKNAENLTQLKDLIVDYAKKIEFLGKAKATDASGISDMVLQLSPVPNKIYPNQSTDVFRVVKDFAGETKLVEDDIDLSFDLSTLKTEGLYAVTLTITDVVGNVKNIELSAEYQQELFVDTYLWGPGKIGVYCLVDNIFSKNYSYTREYNDINQKTYFHVTGDKGEYGIGSWSSGTMTQSSAEIVWDSATKKTIVADGGTTTFEKPKFNNFPYVYIIAKDEFGNFSWELVY